MAKFPKHLFAEPEPDPDTLANLGPLAPLAGTWEGQKGKDVKPTENGAEEQIYVERIELIPIDPQMNGPQLLYGLRYHTHVVKPGEVEMYHDQTGYWLWEPATGRIIHTLSIPRGQTALAKGKAKPGARSFTVKAKRGKTENGICSAPFLEENFRTDSFAMTVTIHDDGSWSYEETTTLKIKGVKKPFKHSDKNRLTRVAAAAPNPLMRAQLEADAAGKAAEAKPAPAKPAAKMPVATKTTAEPRTRRTAAKTPVAAASQTATSPAAKAASTAAPATSKTATTAAPAKPAARRTTARKPAARTSAAKAPATKRAATKAPATQAPVAPASTGPKTPTPARHAVPRKPATRRRTTRRRTAPVPPKSDS